MAGALGGGVLGGGVGDRGGGVADLGGGGVGDRGVGVRGDSEVSRTRRGSPQAGGECRAGGGTRGTAAGDRLGADDKHCEEAAFLCTWKWFAALLVLSNSCWQSRHWKT